MAKEFLNGMIKNIMKENLKIIESKDMEFIFGLMEVCIKVIGSIFRWMEKVNLHGQTTESSKESTKMVRKMVMEFSDGRMENNVKELGKMGRSRMWSFLATTRIFLRKTNTNLVLIIPVTTST